MQGQRDAQRRHPSGQRPSSSAFCGHLGRVLRARGRVNGWLQTPLINVYACVNSRGGVGVVSRVGTAVEWSCARCRAAIHQLPSLHTSSSISGHLHVRAKFLTGRAASREPRAARRRRTAARRGESQVPDGRRRANHVAWEGARGKLRLESSSGVYILLTTFSNHFAFCTCFIELPKLRWERLWIGMPVGCASPGLAWLIYAE